MQVDPSFSPSPLSSPSIALTDYSPWYQWLDAVLVTGPAGAGKSTFCASLITHAQSLGRSVHLFNLDPAADKFEYPPSIDIKDLVSLEEVMQDLELGPNGGLIYCFEYSFAPLFTENSMIPDQTIGV